MEQLSFFDAEKRYEKLTELGDPLEKLNKVMDWEMFREKLTAVCQKEDYTKGGRPAIDVIIKFKASVIRRIYTLSFDQAEYQINDRLSFMRFLGLGVHSKVLDSRTIWDFENTLAQAGVMDELFEMLIKSWKKKGSSRTKAQLLMQHLWMHPDRETAVMTTKELRTVRFLRSGRNLKTLIN